MKVLISAAEASSDVHGAELLRALRKRVSAGVEVEAFGIGGPRLQAEGLRSLVDARELLSMGFFEVLSRLPRIFRALNRVALEVERERPDAIIVIDYPDFHFKLVSRLRPLGIPTIYFIPPKVWAWRKGRIRKLRELFSAILCIFPFEQDFFAKEGLPVTYVGNPLLDELPLAMTRVQAREKLGVSEGKRLLCLMPGSRPSELSRHLEVMLDGAEALSLRLGGQLGIRIPLPATADVSVLEARVSEWKSRKPGLEEHLDIRVSQGDSAETLLAADSAWVKSGTSTLEAALLGCPHLVLYKPNPVSCFIFFHLIRYRDPVGLVNLILRDTEGAPRLITRELLCSAVTAESLAEEGFALMTDPALRARMSRDFAELKTRMLDGVGSEGPSARAADAVLATLRRES